MNQHVRIATPGVRNSGISIFRLRFRNGATIGPSLLKRLWSQAAGSENVGVSRDSMNLGPFSIDHTYVVSASVCPANLDSVEADLRRLLQDRLPVAHVELRRLV